MLIVPKAFETTRGQGFSPHSRCLLILRAMWLAIAFKCIRSCLPAQTTELSSGADIVQFTLKHLCDMTMEGKDSNLMPAILSAIAVALSLRRMRHLTKMLDVSYEPKDTGPEQQSRYLSFEDVHIIANAPSLRLICSHLATPPFDCADMIGLHPINAAIILLRYKQHSSFFTHTSVEMALHSECYPTMHMGGTDVALFAANAYHLGLIWTSIGAQKDTVMLPTYMRRLLKSRADRAVVAMYGNVRREALIYQWVGDRYVTTYLPEGTSKMGLHLRPPDGVWLILVEAEVDGG